MITTGVQKPLSFDSSPLSHSGTLEELGAQLEELGIGSARWLRTLRARGLLGLVPARGQHGVPGGRVPSVLSEEQRSLVQLLAESGFYGAPRGEVGSMIVVTWLCRGPEWVHPCQVRRALVEVIEAERSDRRRELAIARDLGAAFAGGHLDLRTGRVSGGRLDRLRLKEYSDAWRLELSRRLVGDLARFALLRDSGFLRSIVSLTPASWGSVDVRLRDPLRTMLGGLSARGAVVTLDCWAEGADRGRLSVHELDDALLERVRVFYCAVAAAYDRLRPSLLGVSNTLGLPSETLFPTDLVTRNPARNVLLLIGAARRSPASFAAVADRCAHLATPDPGWRPSAP